MAPVIAGLAGVVIARRGRKAARGKPVRRFEESGVSDVVFVVLTLALFAVLALVVRGVEKL
ncbi:hypothetical protein O7632_00695 [Solwaraspora sp. WMMD406]|uniref:hypothetical protein n=1 Tax=Solwaraspora sp. WMMD406 TaxID=3016095 RepID=UPI002417A209|nr:hypothetical protein [Solwaraspora sp. WMMD406]MDG4762641.1 hypothetical protein [Solwaraspora sp. WMMD406]